jgi:hypothetical protein
MNAPGHGVGQHLIDNARSYAAGQVKLGGKRLRRFLQPGRYMVCDLCA